jgi:hypothetical protein
MNDTETTDAGTTDTATQTFGWVDANADGVLDVAP